MKTAHPSNEDRRPDGGAIMPPRPGGCIDRAPGGLKVAAVSRNPDTVRHLSELLDTEDGAIQLEVWAADWPGGAAQLAALIERNAPNVLLLDASADSGEGLPELERLMARYPDMAVLLVGVRQQPECVLAAMEKRMHLLSCIKWRRSDLQSRVEVDYEQLQH